MTMRTSCWESGEAFSPPNQGCVTVLAGVKQCEQPELPPGAGGGGGGCSQLPGRSHLRAVVTPTLLNLQILGCVEAVGVRDH